MRAERRIRRINSMTTHTPKTTMQATMTRRSKQKRNRRSRAGRRCLRLEPLEMRRVLASFLVTTTADVIDSNDAVTSLREAIVAANGAIGADTIEFDPGVFDFGSRIELTLGQFEITEGLTISGPGDHPLQIDGGGNSRIFNFFSSADDLTLEGVSITGGMTTGDDLNSTESGAAIRFASAGTLTLNDVTLVDNHTTGADARGGAIFADPGNVALNQSVVLRNSTAGLGASGGGIFARSGSVTLVDSIVSGNMTLQDGAQGGGIASTGGVVSLQRSQIISNRTEGESADGGGVFSLGGISTEASVVSTNVTMGQDADGGGIFASGSVDLVNSDISGNRTEGRFSGGGGIATDSATVSIEESSITHNQTSGEFGYGGGIVTVRGDVTISQTTISGNTASGADSSGGGLHAFFGSLAVVASTITANTSAGEGGGIGFTDNQNRTLVLQNSIVAGNTDSGAAPDFQAPADEQLLAVESSLIGDNTGTTLDEAAEVDFNGNFIGDPGGDGIIDPILGSLTLVGTTRVHPLLSASLAVDSGNNSLAAAVPNDQRGEPFQRVSDGVVDMGSFELQSIDPSGFVVTTADDELDFSNSAVSLREAIVTANGTPGANIISFDPAAFAMPSTITLTLGEITITDSTSIEGPGQTLLSIAGQGVSRLATVAKGSANVLLSDVTITHGRTTVADARGGGIQFLSSGTLTLRDSTVTDNHTLGDGASGGGVFSDSGTVVLLRSSVTQNSTGGEGALGGGVHGGGGIVATDSTIADNLTGGGSAHGGGVFANRLVGTAITLNRSTLADNRSEGADSNGGGIAIGSGAMRLSNSTISQNTASGDGGGLFSQDGSAGTTQQVISTTIAHNQTGGSGGGLSIVSDASSSLVLYNSIVAENLDGGSSPDLDLSQHAGDLKLEASLIGDNTGTGLSESQTPDTFGNLIGAPSPGLGTIDPLLGSLGFRGGVTLSHSLLPGSPAINAGTSLLLGGATSDQRGSLFARVAEGAPDMGSFETQSIDEALLIVNTATDELDFSNAELSLREALDLAEGSLGADTIRFDPVIFGQPSSMELVLGELRIASSVTILGPGQDLLTIDAQDQSRVFHITGGSSNVLIDGLTMTGGQTTDPNQDAVQASRSEHSGGAIRFDATGTLTVRNATVTENQTLGDDAGGGAIAVERGNLILENSRVTDNATEGERADGGAIALFDGTLTVSDSMLLNNAANGIGSSGGAIYVTSTDAQFAAEATISGSTISDNSATMSGGGVALHAGDLSLEKSIVSDNRIASVMGSGGGIFFQTGTLSVSESRIESNLVTGNDSGGGGIRTIDASFELTDSSVSGNSVSGDSSFGGGLAITNTSLHIANSTISANNSLGIDATGGGIDARYITFDVVNSTITGNSASSKGGGINLVVGTDRPISLHNTILAGNFDTGAAPDLAHPVDSGPSVRFSLIGNNAGSTLTEAQTTDAMGNLIGSANGGGIIDPMLGPLAINGGITRTHTPLAGSPLIDAGSDILAVGADSNPLTSDQRGAPFSRFSDTVDIGSFEVQPPREPIIRWTNPENIFVGTELGTEQLDAESDTPGTFIYTPSSGTALSLGDGQTLSVQFTPDDTVNYAATTATVEINVVEQADLGDAPDSYSTLRSSDGPRHVLGSLTLGSSIDVEVEGQPSSDANGDGSDDDGVAFITSLIADPVRSTAAAVIVNVSSASRLDAWIDFDGDGIFDHPSEHIGGGISIPVTTGDNIVPFDIPAGATSGESFARFRISNVGGLLPTGSAVDGEVEDYQVSILDGGSEPTVHLALPRGSVTLLGQSGELVVQRRSTELFRAISTSVGRYEIVGDTFSNVLTIDTSGGPAIPAGGLNYDGTDRVNTVRLVGTDNSLDLSREGNVEFQNIDVIDMTDLAESTITLDARAARAMDPTGGGVIMVGSKGDQLEFRDGADWRMAEPIDVAGFSFSVVTLGDTFVQVDFASAWQNLAQPSDVNNDGRATAGDALRIINELSRRSFSDPTTARLDAPSSVSPWPNTYFDQSGDGLATALDALRVINQLAREQNGGGSGEGETVTAVASATVQAGPRSTAESTKVAAELPVGRSTSINVDFRDEVTTDLQRLERNQSPASKSTPAQTDDAANVDQLLSDRSFLESVAGELEADV